MPRLACWTEGDSDPKLNLVASCCRNLNVQATGMRFDA
jgi:hypothetical protein